MSKIALSPDPNGAGIFTIASPNSGTNRTLTLPDNTGTIVSTASTPTFTGAVTAPAFTPNSSTVPTDGMYLPTTSTVAFATGTTERMRITSAGEVYIAGTADQGAYNLQVAGTGVWGAGAYTNGSDARIKEDVEPIAPALDVVEKLNPVTYRYKESWSKDQSIQPGFIAQELLTALEGTNYVDGVVSQGGSEGYYSVAYQNIIPILTKAIQELNAKVEAQAAEIAALKEVK